MIASFIHCIPSLATGFSLLLLTGCMPVGLDYVRPHLPAPPQWSTRLEAGLSSERIDPRTLTKWWALLDDLTLVRLVERAVAGNLDLREARSRVREARARRGIAAADRFPTLRASGAETSRGTSQETGSGRDTDLYATGFDASWELDVFGGTQRAIEAAQADLEASEEHLRDVLVTLLAEVALNYVEVRAFQTRLSIVEANRKAQQETYALTHVRFQAGLTTQLDVEQAHSNLETTRAQIPTLQVGLAEATHRLAVLLGHSPGALADELAAPVAIPVPPLAVAVGVPADTVRRRPDVRQAERELAAQTARVGAATADLYPKLSLPGSIGLEALSPGKVFLTSSSVYQIGPQVVWTLFDAGSIRQNIEVQSALQEQALIRYEAAVLAALEEVENALVAYAKEQVRRQSLLAATQAAQRAVELARNQYVSGLIDFQTVLDAQRSALSLQDQFAESEGLVTSHLISLYKALGGGWTAIVPSTSRRRSSPHQTHKYGIQGR